MDQELLTIREAAQFLGVSVDTLRRWDKGSKLIAVRKAGGTHRYYKIEDLEKFLPDLMKLASKWAIFGGGLPSEFYCPNSAVFQARLISMQDQLISSGKVKDIFSLIVAITGEIGDNSFAHNLGNWPDVPGIFFGYDIGGGIIVLADRGVGLLATLKRVKSSLENHQDALHVAFTEMISGRAPEERGNGLKFVRKVISKNKIDLFFQSGDAELDIKSGTSDLIIGKAGKSIRGCLAIIKF